jgi:hypothetical protein
MRSNLLSNIFVCCCVFSHDARLLYFYLIEGSAVQPGQEGEVSVVILSIVSLLY